MNREYDVLCIGQADRDIILTNVPEEFFQRQGDTFFCGKIVEKCGGDAANQSIVLSALGDHAAFYGRIDPYEVGEKLISMFRENGVDTSLTVRDPECRNFSVVVTVEQNQRHAFLIGEGGHYGLEKKDLDYSLFAKTRAVMFGSLFCMGKLDSSDLKNILNVCFENKTLTVADMTFDVDGIGAGAYDSLYERIDYLIPSYSEALYVTGEKEPEKMADHFLRMGARHVIIKLGGDGCFYKDHKDSFSCGTYPIDPVDTTGCGDNFASGLVHSLLKGASSREAVRFAAACGAVNALGIGANGNVTSEQSVIDFIGRMPELSLS